MQYTQQHKQQHSRSTAINKIMQIYIVALGYVIRINNFTRRFWVLLSVKIAPTFAQALCVLFDGIQAPLH
jgi:hypothetical protein